ncbi:polysaccharide pyruvyl transferase family protein [Vibrio litoralis]|uniref:polysaccharide pyruvyl transferase family protein n=1 Tax=Vibrio litoralis TaxID=335972 RepID=UPI001868F32D|nr:polysaccharide pyruvyl transferase family protein [Vibrio litoralis]
MFIEIKGVQFVNKGAALMLTAVLEQLDEHYKGVNLVLEPNNKSPYLDRCNVGAYQKLNLRKRWLDFTPVSYMLPNAIRKYLKNKWGIVTEKDVDIILDASGFAYGDQWSNQSIINMCNEIERFHKNGKKYIFLPQALGPFSDKKVNKKLSQSLSKASLICAREKESYENIRKLSSSNNIFQFGDFTNLVKGVPDETLSLANSVLIVPNSNMCSHRNSNKQWQENYLRFMFDSVKAIKALGLTPVVLNHEGSADDQICQQIVEEFNGGIDVLYKKDPAVVKGVISQSKAIICSRFHGCVSALSQGTPCLGTSWSHKYEKLFEEYNRSPFLVAPDVTQIELEKLLSSAIDTVDDTEYLNSITKFKQNSKDMWNKVFGLI